jgi:hypothetical protein
VFDYLRVEVDQLDRFNLLRNDKLSFRLMKNRQGEKTGRVAYMQNMRICCFLNDNEELTRATIDGSIHKFACGGDNSGLFTVDQFRDALLRLSEGLCIDIGKTRLLSYEFGLNLKIAGSAFWHVKAFLYFKRSAFQQRYYSKNGGVMAYLDLQQYRIKIYDKGSQVNSQEEILRIEIHVKKRQLFSRFGVERLEDLLNPLSWDHFLGFLQSILKFSILDHERYSSSLEHVDWHGMLAKDSGKFSRYSKRRRELQYRNPISLESYLLRSVNLAYQKVTYDRKWWVTF